jgi:glycosyltransferase involved in cell wall biosynthesis
VRRLRVGIDGRAFSSPAAGVRRYVTELGSALLALGDAVDVVALGGSCEVLPQGIGFVDEPWHPPTNLGWTIAGLPRAAARAGVDLIHAPAYTAPLWGAVPTVLTIHDVSYERHPEWYPYRRDWLRRAFYRSSAHAAAHILTDSEFSRREIGAAYGIPLERVTVAHPGVSAAFAPVSSPSLPGGVTTPFLLHVGDLHERRNLPVAIDALAGARPRLGSLLLVLAGVDRGVGARLDEQAASANVPLLRLGAVDDAQLRSLYQAAAALVYPSRYEGFGLPVLEAMASGTPVLASRAASIPEVLGETGILLDPDDPAAWADAIVAVMTDPGQQARMRAAGVARASEFTWARTARITLDVYRRVTKQSADAPHGR